MILDVRARRQFTHVAFVIFSICAYWGCHEAPIDPSDESRKRNIILITVDALRADAVGYMNDIPGRSPSLDLIAQESVIFTQAIASSSKTTASMASLMTGRYPNFEDVKKWKPSTMYGFSDFAPATEKERPGLTSNVMMLAEILGASGYQTVGFNTNLNLSKFNNFHQGFEKYQQFQPYLRRIGEVRTHRLIGHYPPAPIVVSRVIRWLRNNQDDRPLFLWVHFMDPHSPYLPVNNDESADPLQSGLSDLEINDAMYHLLLTQMGEQVRAANYPRPDELRVDEETVVHEAFQLYNAEISYFDQEFSKLVAELKTSGLWKSSTVMITSDHGEEFLDHGFVSHHFRSAMAEELIRVPLLVKPSRGETFEPGQRVEAVVRMVDFAPTLLDYAGVDEDSYAEAHMDGTSLRTLVEGQQTRDRTAFISTIEWGIVHNGKWKYRLEKPHNPTGESSERLFLIRDDPMEERDVANEHPKQLAKMREQFKGFASALQNRQASGSSGVERPESTLSEEDREHLEALGYFQD